MMLALWGSKGEVNVLQFMSTPCQSSRTGKVFPVNPSPILLGMAPVVPLSSSSAPAPGVVELSTELYEQRVGNRKAAEAPN